MLDDEPPVPASFVPCCVAVTAMTVEAAPRRRAATGTARAASLWPSLP